MTDNIYKNTSEERKKQQELGNLPEWYSTGGYQLFNAKYLYEANSWKEQIERICKTAAKHMPPNKSKEWEYKFSKLFWKGWLSPATPVLANMGTNRGLPVSCSGMYVKDSVAGFYEALTETAVLSKHGFGTASCLSDIRPRGTPISTGGKASGVLPVIKMFVQQADDINQGSRRGAWAGYLDIQHGDFWEVLDHLEAHPDSLNIGWIIKDNFINKLHEGDEEALKRYQAVMRVKLTLGKGYFQFIDKCNRQVPETYKELGLDIKSSQLCVAPETLVLTNTGHKKIADLHGKCAEVWNGEEWSNVRVEKTSEASKLITVKTSQGFSLTCTPEHKFYIKQGASRTGRIIERTASDLMKGDKLVKLSTPVIQGKDSLQLAYENGFYSGDGCNVDSKSRIYLYGEKRLLAGLFANKIGHYIQDKQNREYFYLAGLQPKFFVPDADYSTHSRVTWLAGLLDSDGCLLTNDKSQTLQVASTEVGFLNRVQLMLQTLGVQSKVVHTRDAGKFSLPTNNGTGKLKLFNCKRVERLLINGVGLVKLLNLGMELHRLKPTGHIPNRDASNFITVESVIDDGRVDATYCFTEPKKHMGVFNGLLTGQCSEIMLHSSEDYTYTCVLSSMNVALYDEWKDTDAVQTAIVFLDCVVSEFLEKAKGIKHLEKAMAFTKKSRALGLGQLGLFSLFQKRMIPPESFEAHMLNIEIAKHIKEEAEKATIMLAELLGEPEWCKGHNRRNTHLIAIAPTKATALLMGGWSEGINPDPAMAFTSSGASGDIDRLNPVLLELIKAKKLSVKRCTLDVLQNGGSVQNVSWLTDEEKAVFPTAFQIDQSVLIRYAAARQKYVDQGQSTNLFFAHDDNEAYISKVNQEAFMNEDILSLYYVYSSSEIKADRTGECLACQ